MLSYRSPLNGFNYDLKQNEVRSARAEIEDVPLVEFNYLVFTLGFKGFIEL